MREMMATKLRRVICIGLCLGLVAGTASYAQETEEKMRFIGEPADVELTPELKRAFIGSIRQKITDLENYITQISNKEKPLEDRLEMINSVVRLFSGENSTIQVSNAATGKVEQYTVRQYFTRLANIKAVMVDITFYKAILLDKAKLAPDNYYYGTATIFQDTKIYRDAEGMDVYHDRTVKQVNFKSKRQHARIGDKRRDVMETMLENIKVKETRKPS